MLFTAKWSKNEATCQPMITRVNSAPERLVLLSLSHVGRCKLTSSLSQIDIVKAKGSSQSCSSSSPYDVGMLAFAASLVKSHPNLAQVDRTVADIVLLLVPLLNRITAVLIKLT